MPFKVELTPAQRMQKLRATLLLDEPWFGVLAMKMIFQECDANHRPDIDTMATDGTYLYYNVDFIAKLPDIEIKTVLAHEVLHVALKHLWRASNRNFELWNHATDHAINNEISKYPKFKLPSMALCDARFKEQAAEQIYATLEKEIRASGAQMPSMKGNPCGVFLTPPKPKIEDPNAPGKGQGQNDPNGGPGQPEQGPPDQGQGAGQDPQILTEADWDVAVSQANIACKKPGQGSNSIDHMLEDVRRRALEPDLEEELRKIIEHAQNTEYTWSRPNRRFIGMDPPIYLPSLYSDQLPKIILALDTSGSMGEEELRLGSSVMSSILIEYRPESMDVIYCDDRIQNIETFTPDDGEMIILNAKGRGGTSFHPVFEHIENEETQPPVLLIYITDLACYGDFPDDPGYPVVWLTPEYVSKEAPYGRTIRCKMH